MKRINEGMVPALAGNAAKSINVIDEIRTKQIVTIKASVIKELRHRESKMRFRVI